MTRETTVIKVEGSTATYVADFPSLGEARVEARKCGGQTVPADVWHEGIGWWEWSRSTKAEKPHRGVKSQRPPRVGGVKKT